MKIDLVIHSSDSNPFYLDFWPLVSKVWKEHFKLNPILLYIDENHDIPIDETYGKVIKMKPISDVPLYLQCLWIRYWYPTQVPDQVCMISDIDMFPISKNYFIEQIKNIADDKYVHLNPTHNFLPSCYHIAKGKLFKEVLKLEDEWMESVTALYNKNLGSDCFAQAPNNPILEGKQQWGADEEYATKCIRSYADQTIFEFIERKHCRIDRSNWIYSISQIENDMYADSHSIRPYEKYKYQIDSLLSIIYSLDT